MQDATRCFCCAGISLRVQVSSIWCPLLGCPTGLGCPRTQNVSTLAHFMSPQAFCGQRRRFYGSKSERRFTEKLGWHTAQAEPNTDQARQRCVGRSLLLGGAAAGQKLFPTQPTANAPILSTFDWNAPVDTNHWHSAASDLLQRFSNFYNNLSAAWKWRYVSPMMLKTFKSMYFQHLVCAFEHFNQASVLIEFCNFYFKIVSPWTKLCRWVLGEMNENVPSSHSERRRIKQRPNPTAGPKKLFWDIITHNIATRQKKFTLKQT